MYDIQHCFICRPSDSTVSEDAGIEPRTVATTALTVKRSNPSAIDLIDENIPIITQVGVLQRYASMHGVGSPWLDTGGPGQGSRFSTKFRIQSASLHGVMQPLRAYIYNV